MDSVKDAVDRGRRCNARAEQCEVDPNAGGAGAKDLVKSRTRIEAVKIVEARAPRLFGLRLGRLSIARNQWLDLVSCVRFEECVGESVKNPQTHTSALRSSSIPSSSRPSAIAK